MRIILLLLTLTVGFETLAQTPNFPQCSSAVKRKDLDGMCPRMEGIHLEDCCPPLIKQPPLKCKYMVYEPTGQPTLVDGQDTVCQDGKDVSVPCCEHDTDACYSEPIELDYAPRLLGRDNQCCFENCPTAAYWRAQPNPRAGVRADHILVSGGAQPMCNKAVRTDKCSAGSVRSCVGDNPCPRPAPQPTPNPTPNPNPNPTPNPTPTTPRPTPTPQPNPQPQPTTPRPTPTPQPNPTPTPSPQPNPQPQPQPPVQGGPT